MVERQISFEFAALFHSPMRAVKKGGNFKINFLMGQMVSFLFCLHSSSEKNQDCQAEHAIIREFKLVERLQKVFFQSGSMKSKPAFFI